ncbi:MAG TPA: cytochrome c3 family protein [Nitrospirota bacterium]|nr:cytochrome c3 family protein [Nitrospirota bacterium]
MKILAASFIAWCCMLLFTAAGHAADNTPRGIIKLDSIAKFYLPVRFDHAKHAAIAGDCGKCHHQHGNSASLPCRECHNLTVSTFKGSKKASFMACKNCHGASDPAAPGMPGLKVAYHRQCFQCHRGMGGVGENPQGCTQICHGKNDQQAKRGTKSAQ